MEASAIRKGSVVAGIDGSTGSERALDWATDEAAARHVPLHVVRAHTGPGPEPDPAADTILEAAVARVRLRRPHVSVTWDSPTCSAAEALVRVSHLADTIAVGSRGHGRAAGALLGSVSLQIAMHAECPVVVVGEHVKGAQDQPRVVVGADGSPLSVAAIGYAFAHASSIGGTLTAVHAWWQEQPDGTLPLSASDPAGADVVRAQHIRLSESLAGWAEQYPDVAVRKLLVRDAPAQALVAESRGADLVVVGSRGMGGFRGLLLGSVSHRVLQLAQCPVAVVRRHGQPGADP